MQGRGSKSSNVDCFIMFLAPVHACTAIVSICQTKDETQSRHYYGPNVDMYTLMVLRLVQQPIGRVSDYRTLSGR